MTPRKIVSDPVGHHEWLRGQFDEPDRSFKPHASASVDWTDRGMMNSQLADVIIETARALLPKREAILLERHLLDNRSLEEIRLEFRVDSTAIVDEMLTMAFARAISLLDDGNPNESAASDQVDADSFES